MMDHEVYIYISYLNIKIIANHSHLLKEFFSYILVLDDDHI
jgi:hypothetical protein